MSGNSATSDLADPIEAVAKLLYSGKPMLRCGDELRIGNKGSVCIQVAGPDKGKWFDHETGKGGKTTIGLVMHVLAYDRANAAKWLRLHGFIIDRPPDGADIAYNYVDEGGALLFQCVRRAKPGKNGSRFAQRRPDGQGGWVWNLKGVRRVLYRLPELLAAPAEAIVWIAEGEKDVDNLRTLGFVATTNAMGSGKWRDEYNAALADRDVVLLPDNDEAGEKHAQAILASLYDSRCTTRAKRVRVLRLPDLPEKGDVSDWLANGGSAATLLELAAAVPDAEPPPPPGTDGLPRGVLDPATVLDVFNRRYALLHDAGSVMVWEPNYDPNLKRIYYTRISVDGFKQLYNNRLVRTGRVDKDSNPIFRPAGNYWLSHEDRKTYLRGVVFRPEQQVPAGTFNLWRNFGVTPGPGGSWNLLRTHTNEVICRNNQELFEYLLDWMAFAVQHPDAQCEVIIIIRGEEGAGKSILGRVLCRLFGQHGLPISDPNHLFGRFNLHLRDCVILLADELFNAGDKAAEAKLKSLTDATLMIEGKNMNAVLAPNFLKIIITSNRDWVVPAGLRARRYLLLDADDRYVGNHAHFAAIWAELEAGGYEAMLHELRSRDISNFNHRAAPKTTGLQDQQIRSLKPEQAWLLDVLSRAYVLRSTIGLDHYFFQWHNVVATERLYASYRSFTRDLHNHDPLPRTWFGKFLVSMGAKHCQPRKLVVGEEWAEVNGERKPVLILKPRGEAYRLGSLDHARRNFTKATTLTINWKSRGK